MTTRHHTQGTQTQSETLAASSAGRTVHYESTDPVHTRSKSEQNGQTSGGVEPGATPPGQRERLQNASSDGRLAPGALPAPSTVAGAIQRARELNDRQADQLVHRCRLHVTAAGCEASTFCTSYCGRKIPSDPDQDGPHCVVCDDLAERDSRTASRRQLEAGS